MMVKKNVQFEPVHELATVYQLVAAALKRRIFVLFKIPVLSVALCNAVAVAVLELPESSVMLAIRSPSDPATDLAFSHSLHPEMSVGTNAAPTPRGWLKGLMPENGLSDIQVSG